MMIPKYLYSWYLMVVVVVNVLCCLIPIPLIFLLLYSLIWSFLYCVCGFPNWLFECSSFLGLFGINSCHVFLLEIRLAPNA